MQFLVGNRNVLSSGTKRPGKPMQNGFVKSFNKSLRDECLNQHIFTSHRKLQSKPPTHEAPANEQA